MSSRSQVLLNIVALAVIIAAVAFVLGHNSVPTSPHIAPATPLASTTAQEAGVATPIAARAIATSTAVAQHLTKKVAPIAQSSATPSATTTGISRDTPSTLVSQAARIENPYPFAPLPPDALNTMVRGALVNILCRSSGSVHPISGSGVIIDTRGVILTNAHVAQYVLLSENPGINLSCVVRTGSPARDTWVASVLYMPPVWVAAHVSEINTADPTGTGEHDYALLLIDGSATNAAAPSQFPALSFDTRNAIGFEDDQVLVASYPAEFIGGLAAENNLYAASSFTTIGQLLTFGSGSVDVVSVGGIIEAQSGSSGGAVVNAWGRIIGLITTTSEAATTAQRDLHALTLSYISADLRMQTGYDLPTILQGNLSQEQGDFNANIFPALIAQYRAQIK